MAIKLRYSPKEIAMQGAAEKEILRYQGKHYLWARHVLGVKLDPHQLAYLEHFDRHQNCLLIGSRRIRKSYSAAVWFLAEATTKPRAEINVHSPALEQSKRNLHYMTERIIRSEIMMAFIERRLGEGIGREAIEFVNGSKIQAKGQASSTDGLGATHQWWEEVDDMDWETLMTRIFPTGSQLKPGFPYGDVRGCRRIATGTIKGRGNLYRLEHPIEATNFRFHVLPKLDCWFGIASGIIPEAEIETARGMMTPAQFARTYLALYTISSDYFPTTLIERCKSPVVELGGPGTGYVPAGRVTLGLDVEGQGDSETASHTVASFVEEMRPGVYALVYVREWEPGSNPREVREELVDLCRIFRPIGGYGDNYDNTLLHDLNEDLFRAGVTKNDVNRHQNKQGAEGWDRWFVRPIRFHGRAKHEMYKRLQSKMRLDAFFYPVAYEGMEERDLIRKFAKQMENIKAKPTAQGYDSFSMKRKAIGDDIVDSVVAALWAQDDRGEGPAAAGSSAKMGGFAKKRFANKSFKKRR